MGLQSDLESQRPAFLCFFFLSCVSDPCCSNIPPPYCFRSNSRPPFRKVAVGTALQMEASQLPLSRIYITFRCVMSFQNVCSTLLFYSFHLTPHPGFNFLIHAASLPSSFQFPPHMLLFKTSIKGEQLPNPLLTFFLRSSRMTWYLL